MEVRALVEKYIWILNLFLIFWLCYFLGGSANAYISSRYISSQKVKAPHQFQVVKANEGTPYQYKTQSILDRNIFNVKTGWEDQSEILGEGADEDIQETTLRAKLLGVIYFFSGAVLNRATIRLIKENKSDIYREGDPLTDDVKIAKIDMKRVILRRDDGQLEELSLEEPGPLGSGSGKKKQEGEYVPKHVRMSPDERRKALDERRKSLGIDNRIRKISDTEYSIERSAITESLSDLNTLFTQMRLTPNFVGEGDERSVEGFRVFRVQPNSIFQKLGIRNGDIILNINGVVMDNPEKGFELLQQLRYENSFSLTLKRNDEDREISYQVTD